MNTSRDMSTSKSVTLEEIQIADYLAFFNIDNILLLIEETKDKSSIRPIIKFLRFLRAKLPSRNLSDKYWDLDQNYLLYSNQKEFKKVINDKLVTIPVGAILESGFNQKGGYGVLLKKAHDSVDEFIFSLEKLESMPIDNNTSKNVSLNELVESKTKFKEHLFDCLCKYFLISVKKDKFILTTLKEKIELKYYKTNMFPKSLYLYQVSLLLTRINSYDETIGRNIYYRLKKTKKHDEIIYSNDAKRELEKYNSAFRNRNKSKRYYEFMEKLDLVFSELDNMERN